MAEFIEMIFKYPFMLRALFVGILVCTCLSLLGVPLVLKRYSMIGDGLSHVAFGSIALATALGLAPMAVSIPIVILTAFLLLRLNDNGKIKGDTAIALISTAAMAIGVIAVSLSKGMNADVNNYMFGSVLAMSKGDVTLSIVLAVVVLAVFILCYNKIFAVTFDETFLKAAGVKTESYNILISFLTATTVVLGMRVMGALLISAVIIFPVVSSMRIFKTFKGVVISSVIISIISFIVGFYFSYQLSTPTGASIVLVNLIIFLITGITAKIKR